MTMSDIILIGGGGHCKAVIDVIEQEGKFRIAGIVDNQNYQGPMSWGIQLLAMMQT